MNTPSPIWLALLCLAASATACGSSSGTTAGSGSATHVQAPPAQSSEPGETDLPASEPAATGEGDELIGVMSTQDVKDYIQALDPVRRQIAIANAAAHRGAQASANGDFTSAAVDSHQVSLHIARARVLAAAVTPPSLLKAAHADLVRSFAVGAKMTARLSSDFAHGGSAMAADIKQHVIPMEKLTVRLANRWYRPMQINMTTLHVKKPPWIDGMFNWS